MNRFRVIPFYFGWALMHCWLGEPFNSNLFAFVITFSIYLLIIKGLNYE